jgi:hypothetical protein
MLLGAVVGAYSLSQKTGGRDIHALPGTSTRGGGQIPLFNRIGLTYLALHVILNLVCFL